MRLGSRDPWQLLDANHVCFWHCLSMHVHSTAPRRTALDCTDTARMLWCVCLPACPPLQANKVMDWLIKNCKVEVVPAAAQ